MFLNLKTWLNWICLSVPDECVSSTLQVHGGSSGIGTFAIQIAKHLGIKVFVTAGLFAVTYMILQLIVLGNAPTNSVNLI
jgi:hypothetical protein